MYNDPNCKPWTSRSWAPQGFSNRDDLIAQDKANVERKSPEGIEEARQEKVGLNRNGGGYFGDGNAAGREASMDTAVSRA
jgi:MFS transporter, SP family, sugar:H+ symporter